LLEIFQYEFMQRAFIVGTILSLITPLLGIFVVLKRYSMLADTLAHISLLGVATGIVLGYSPHFTTIVIVLLSAWLIEFLRNRFNLYSDSLLALFLSGSLSISIILISLSDNFNASLLSYLFGSILSVQTEDIWIVSIIGVLIGIVMLLFINDYIYLSLDEEVAQVAGIKVAILNILFLTLVSLLIAFSIHIIGSLLISALIIIPVVSAIQYRRGFFQTLQMAILFSFLAVFFGLILSFYFSIPSGASIVVNSLIIFLFSIWKNRR